MTERYFNESSDGGPRILKYFINGEWKVSKTDRYMDCYNPSTGEVIAKAPQCTSEEVEQIIEAANNAYPGWSSTPVNKRVQVLFKMKHLVDTHLDELTYLLAEEMVKHGRKPWAIS